jgi:uncharacterized protein
MGRLILIAVAIAVAVWLLRRAFADPKDRAKQHPERAGTPDELVRCAHCGLHLPRSEARSASDRLYCSDEHAARGPRDIG